MHQGALRTARLQTSPLCAGNNAIAKLDSIGYMRRFVRLQIVNLAGNPVARNPNYRCVAECAVFGL